MSRRCKNVFLGLMVVAGCGGDDVVGAPADTDAETDTGTDALPDEEMLGAGTPLPAGLKKLRSWEYRNSILDLLGVDVEPAGNDGVRANFTAIAASQDCTDDVVLETYETRALTAAAEAFARDPNPLTASGCIPGAASDECVRTFIADFGLRAWRRPLTNAEVDKYVGLVGSLSGIYDGDVIKGAELTVAALIQSPYFLNRVELGTATDADPQIRKYTPYEMASRLSYTLAGTTPDSELLAAAADDQLRTEESVREHAVRLLADPAAELPLSMFWREHLGVDRLTISNYPRAEGSSQIYGQMRLEGRAMALRLTWPGIDALEFLTASQAVLGPNLAQIYGADFEGTATAEVDLPPGRRGFLTSGVFLVTNSHPGKTSPTRRGKFVLERVLCRDIPPPPGDVDLTLPDAAPGEATRRELLEQHANNATCAACHRLLDPPGFAFETYDSIGGARELDNELPIDSTGTIDGQTFADASELIDVLAAAPDAARCVVLQTFRAQTGHIETDEQEDYIVQLTENFEASGHDFRTLMTDIVASEGFRFARGFVGGQ